MYCMIIFFILLIINIVYNMDSLYESIYSSLNIWLLKIVPSFFIFYILSSFLLKRNFLNNLSFIIKPFFSFESNKSYEVLLLSILISNPTTIKQAKLLYDNNEISFNDYKKIIYLSIFSNPLFLLSFINYKTVIFFIIIQFIVIFIIDKAMKLQKSTYTGFNDNYKQNSLFIINQSLNDVVYILLLIATSISFINLIKETFINTLLIFNLNVNNLDVYLSFFEVTKGIISIQKLNLNINITNGIILFVITFQGLAINLQNYCIINNSEINYKKAILIRFIESLIALIIYLLFIYIATSLLP